MNAEFECIGVVGAGQMGRGIAQVAAAAGLEVRVLDVRRDVLERSLDRIEQKLAGLPRAHRIGAVRGDTTPSVLGDCEFVIEAAIENLALKERIFRDLDVHLRKNAILASNTSSISLTRLAGVTERPGQVVGMHFMNPVPRMKLVEVVRALQTSEATYDATCALAERLGKTCITTKDMPGFIVNRMLIPFINEACFALQEGLGSAEDIDQAAKLGLAHPMGPLALADLIGLDTCLFISEVLQRDLGDDKYRPPVILRNYVAAGWLGRKSGRGFYEYDAQTTRERKVA